MKPSLVIIFVLFLVGCTTETITKENNTIKEGTNQEGTPTLEENSDIEIATFAGGCFWCTESDFEHVPGVIQVISGYTGGELEDPTYKEVSAGGTGHVEAVQVYYNPNLVSYQQLLDAYWRMINPTDIGGQFVDRGYQYTSAIFYHNKEQKQLAETSKQKIQESGKYDQPIATRIEPFQIFYKAEEYHQDYYKKNPIKYKYYRGGSGRDAYLEEAWGEKNE